MYVLITNSTPLTPSQALGSGIAFLIGWLGLAYAGSEALRAMLGRRARVAATARERSDAVVRRLAREGLVPPGQPVPPEPDAAVPSGPRTPLASSERAPARAAAVARRGR